MDKVVPPFARLEPSRRAGLFAVISLCAAFWLLGFGLQVRAETPAPLVAGVKVRIEHDNKPPARFIPLLKEEKPVDPLTCLSKEDLRDKYQNDKSVYRAFLDKKTTCAKNLVEATALKAKIDDVKKSIAALDTLLQALRFSQQEMSGITALAGEAIFTIPAGENAEKEYNYAGKVKIQCLSGLKGAVSNEVSLGTITTSKVNLFTSETENVTNMFTAARQKNKEAQRVYDGLIKGSKVSDDTRQMPINQLSALQKALGDVSASVSKNALAKYYGNLESAKKFVSVSVSVKTGTDGKRIPCSTPFYFGGAVGEWVEGTITIDGVSYENACLPEKHLLKQTKEGFTANIDFFQKRKAEQEKLLAPLERRLEEVAKDNYGCETAPEGSGDVSVKLVLPGSGTVATLPTDNMVAQSSQPVRKSGTTPADRHAASSLSATTSPFFATTTGTFLATSTPFSHATTTTAIATSTAPFPRLFATSTATTTSRHIATSTPAFATTTATSTVASTTPSLLSRALSFIAGTIYDTVSKVVGKSTKATSASANSSTNVLVFEEQNPHDILSPVSGDAYRWFADGSKFLPQFYKTHGDDYDFMALFPTKPLQYSDSRVINRNIDGIGAYKVKNPEIKRLQTLTVQDYYPKWEILPNFDGRSLRKNLIHEIGHHWSAFIKGLPVNADGMHWSNNLDLFSGDARFVDPLAYYQWVVKNNQEICVDGNADSSIIKFSDLSLYLMGLIPPEEVRPIFVHEFEKKSSNNQFQNLWGPQCEEAHKFTETKTISVQDIISANGVRNPPYQESQKNFRIAFIIVSEKGSVVPSGFVDYVRKYADALPKAWDEMTGGRSQMSVAMFPFTPATTTLSSASTTPFQFGTTTVNTTSTTTTAMTTATTSPFGFATTTATTTASENATTTATGTRGTDGVNLSVTKPAISGASAGAGKVYAGEMTLRAAIMNTSSTTIQKTFTNTWQYRDVTRGGTWTPLEVRNNVSAVAPGDLPLTGWTDWVKFEISGLAANAKADVTYSWTGGAGEWEFRLVADSGGELAESNEQDNYSEPVRVSIVSRSGETPPEVAPTGTAKLMSNKPVISGTSAGLGKVRAGTMTFAAKVTNVGDGISRAFKALLQYSRDDVNWSDWVQIDLPSLGPKDTSDVNYSWTGGEGVWYVRACDDITDTCSASTKFEVVSI